MNENRKRTSGLYVNSEKRMEILGRLGVLDYQIYEKSQLQFALTYEGRAELKLFEREGEDGFTVGTYDAAKDSIVTRSGIWKWDESPQVLPQKYPDGAHSSGQATRRLK